MLDDAGDVGEFVWRDPRDERISAASPQEPRKDCKRFINHGQDVVPIRWLLHSYKKCD